MPSRCRCAASAVTEQEQARARCGVYAVGVNDLAHARDAQPQFLFFLTACPSSRT